MTAATKAYKTAAGHRSLREQEADIFRRVNGGLRLAREQGSVQRARALADNRLLWITVDDLMRDPSNALPSDLRASIISIGKSVQREMDRPSPDFGFLIGVNENLAAGLAAGS